VRIVAHCHGVSSAAAAAADGTAAATAAAAAATAVNWWRCHCPGVSSAAAAAATAHNWWRCHCHGVSSAAAAAAATAAAATAAATDVKDGQSRRRTDDVASSRLPSASSRLRSADQSADERNLPLLIVQQGSHPMNEIILARHRRARPQPFYW
jgi:hypothetical protein